MMERCDNCGKEFKEFELQQVTNFDADEIMHACGNCLTFYTKCDRCGMYRPNDLVEFDPETETHVCNLCHEEHYEENAVPMEGLDLEEESWQD